MDLFQRSVKERAMNRARPQQNQRGVSTLEFIVVLPILLLVFLGTMELSRAWFTLTLVTNAAREGARVGSVTPPDAGGNFDPAPAETRIDTILTAANLLTGATRSVACSSAPCGNGDQIQANVAVTFDTVIPGFLPMLVGIPIQSTTAIRYE